MASTKPSVFWDKPFSPKMKRRVRMATAESRKSAAERARRYRKEKKLAAPLVIRHIDRTKSPQQRFREKPGVRERENTRISAHKKLHPEKSRANTAARRSAKAKAMPIWVSKSELHNIYAAAATTTRETGIEHHVDHIVPLVSPLVCGLHVPWNLQVLPGQQNRIKGNRFRSDAPDDR